ncbi:CocE/NonD family hydrolase [Mycobacterium sp.]|uniref:CocE/NonD family hydrolase n=1 Tax=Mycobacterium sp. TaxID=1785 RepID=UPI003D6BAF95
MTEQLPEPRVEQLPPNARFDIGGRQYPRMYRFSNIAIRMSDGAVLSADLILPGDLAGPLAGPLPAVLNFTPYNKMLQRFSGGSRMRALGNWIGPSDRKHFTGRDLLHTLAGGGLAASFVNPTLVSRGYAYLMVDVRGTGTSTGKWDFFGKTEQQDYLEVLRWVSEQSWCNGKLAVTGISYGAVTALIIAGLQPDGLEAIFAIEGGENPVRELGITGGVPSPFIGIWLATVNVLKWIPSIGGLTKTRAWRQYLRDRVQVPFSWSWHALQIALVKDHPDVFLNAMWADKLPRLDKITVPTWIHGGWHDVYNRSNFRMYDRIATPPGAKQVVIDDSYHNAPGSGFGAPDAPQYLDELQCAWFDRWVKGIDNGIDRYGPITVRRLGGGWIPHDRYPDPAARAGRLYLSADNSGTAKHAAIDASLVAEAPDYKQRLSVPAGRTSIRSNNTAIISTGLATLLGRAFGCDDRHAEATAVTFTTEAFDADVVLSGPLNLHLWVEAEGSDAFWSVTVTDVEPTGVSGAISRGALLSSLRAIDEATSTYVDGELLVAEHPFTAESVLPVVPGQPFDVDIDINPTEAVLRAGHRLRVAVSRASFPRHFFSRSQRRKIKGQAIIVDPAHPSYLTFLAVPTRL